MPNASISDVILYHHCYVFHVSKGEHFSHFLATQINLTLQLCFWDTLNPDTIQQQNQGLTHAYLGYLSSGIQVIILVIIPYHNSNSVQLDTWNTVWMFILDLKKCNKGNKDKCTLHIDEKKSNQQKKPADDYSFTEKQWNIVWCIFIGSGPHFSSQSSLLSPISVTLIHIAEQSWSTQN